MKLMTRNQMTTNQIAVFDLVELADGQVVAVPHANLAAAKDLLAAQRAAERRMAVIAQERERLLASRAS